MSSAPLFYSIHRSERVNLKTRSLPEKKNNNNKGRQQKITTEMLKIEFLISIFELFKACFIKQGCAKANQLTGSGPTAHRQCIRNGNKQMR